MPPVFGPTSPSPSRLWSRAGASGTTVSPSHSASSDTSGPSSRSSTSTRAPADPNRRSIRHDCTAASASATDEHTNTPLPAASPSALITTLPSASAIAICAAAGVSHTENPAVGTIAASITDLANVLDPSSCAAAPRGPNAAMPASSSRSTRPPTSGASGPTTTRSAASELRQLGQALVVGDGHIVQRGDVPDTGVPGRGVQIAQQRRARQPPRECVLAPAGSNE